MKVYGNPRSTCTRKVLALLNERQAPFELVVVDLASREQKSEAHLARHPFGVVPVLEEPDGFRLYESRAILRYLDRTLPGAKLTPEDPRAFARMEQLVSIEQSYFSPGALTILKASWGRAGFGPEQVEAARPVVAKALDVADRALAEAPYLAGEAFTLADLSWMPYVEGLLGTDHRGLIVDRPNVARWWAQVGERPAWKQVVGRA